jgi:hypothetical protein
VPSLLELVNTQCGCDGFLPLEDGTDEPFPCDYVLGSMSLPWRVGAAYSNFDGTPYYGVPRSTLVPQGRSQLHVGLVWRGSPAYGKDVLRSMAFSNLVSLFDISGTAFYSLQLGDGAKEVSNLGFDGFVADLAPFAKTWTDTASLIAALDVVVTVDTAVAHLAGALGKPVLIMVTRACDWRWKRGASELTEWYDSARVIRQQAQGKWDLCIQRVKNHLERILYEKSQSENCDNRLGGQLLDRGRNLEKSEGREKAYAIGV